MERVDERWRLRMTYQFFQSYRHRIYGKVAPRQVPLNVGLNRGKIELPLSIRNGEHYPAHPVLFVKRDVFAPQFVRYFGSRFKRIVSHGKVNIFHLAPEQQVSHHATGEIRGYPLASKVLMNSFQQGQGI
jgi:hypothetical protein